MTERCDAFEGLLAREADGTLDAQDRARLHTHVSSCTACAGALAAQREMRAALRALADQAVVTRAGARVMATLRAEARPADVLREWLDALDWRRWTWRLAPIAAALALAVGTVSRPTTPAALPPDPPAVVDTSGTTRPASAALVTGEVTGQQLLQLLLSGGPDAALPVSSPVAGGGP